MTGNMTSTGRGGAGNINDHSGSPRLQPEDLETPRLKTPIVTTGRGGSGNMAKNTDPDVTRARQDVEPIPRRSNDAPAHVGRGGAANVVQTGLLLDDEDHAALKDGGARKNSGDHNTGLAARGKEWLLRKKS